MLVFTECFYTENVTRLNVTSTNMNEVAKCFQLRLELKSLINQFKERFTLTRLRAVFVSFLLPRKP